MSLETAPPVEESPKGRKHSDSNSKKIEEKKHHKSDDVKRSSRQNSPRERSKDSPKESRHAKKTLEENNLQEAKHDATTLEIKEHSPKEKIHHKDSENNDEQQGNAPSANDEMLSNAIKKERLTLKSKSALDLDISKIKHPLLPTLNTERPNKSRSSPTVNTVVKLHEKPRVHDPKEGTLNPQFLTMTRAELNACEYLTKQSEAKQWIESVLKKKLSSSDLHKCLQDGVILCKLINAIYPNSIKEDVVVDEYQSTLRKNIKKFLQACYDQGFQEGELFQVEDLFDKKNMVKVINSLQKIARVAENKGFPRWEKTSKTQFSPKEIQSAKKLEGVNIFSGKRVSEEERMKRESAKNKKEEAEKLALEEVQRKQKEQEAKKQEEMALQEELIQKKQNIEVKYGGKENLDSIKKTILNYEISLENGNTILHCAVNAQSKDVVRYLLEESGVDPNISNNSDDIPLHIAAMKSNEVIVELLIQAKSSVNAINLDGNSPLHIAAYHGRIKNIVALLEGGAEINAHNIDLNTPLLLTIKRSHIKCMTELILRGADVNCMDKDGNFCLHVIAEKGEELGMNLLEKFWDTTQLMKLNVDINARNKYNATPLHVAAENDNLEMVEKLTSLGADLNTQRDDGWSPLYSAAYNGDLEMVKFLASNGADVNGTNEEGWTPLHAACSQGQNKIVQSLVKDFNASINVLNEQGTTPLFHAVSSGRRTITEFLVAHGADVNLSKEGSWKPIHAACFNEFKKLTNFLVTHGADLNARCVHVKNYSPLHILIATDEPPMDLIELLVNNGARLDVTHDNGGTPLHLAAFWGHLEVAKLLVEKGAPLSAKNKRKKMPIDVGAEYSHKELVEYLAEKMGVPIPAMKEKQPKTKVMKAPNTVAAT